MRRGSQSRMVSRRTMGKLAERGGVQKKEEVRIERRIVERRWLSRSRTSETRNRKN